MQVAGASGTRLQRHGYCPAAPLVVDTRAYSSSSSCCLGGANTNTMMVPKVRQCLHVQAHQQAKHRCAAADQPVHIISSSSPRMPDVSIHSNGMLQPTQVMRQPKQNRQQEPRQQRCLHSPKGCMPTAASNSGTSNAAAITRTITHASSWPAVADVWRAWGPSMNAVHLSALLVKAAKLRKSTSSNEDQEINRCLLEMLATVPTQLAACRAREVVSIAWAAAKLRVFPVTGSTRRPQCSAKQRQQDQPVLSSMKGFSTAGQLSTQPAAQAQPASAVMVYSGFVERPPAHSLAQHMGHGLNVSEEWWQAVLGSAMQLLPSCNGQDVSMLLWALVALQSHAEMQCMQHHTQQKWQAVEVDEQQGEPAQGSSRSIIPAGMLQQLLQVSQPHLHTYSAQALSNTVWALAKLRVLPDATWQAAFLESSCRQLHKSEPQALANTAWALAVMEVRPPAAWQDKFIQRSAACAVCAEPASLSQMLWAAARIPGFHAPREWVAASLTAAQPRLSSFLPQDLANTLWAVGSLGHPPNQAWMQDALRAVGISLRAFQPLELSAVLVALAALHYNPGQHLIRDAAKELLQRRPAPGVQVLSNTLWALAQLRYVPERPSLQAGLLALAQQVEDVGPQEMAQLCWALGRMRVHPGPEVMQALMRELLVQLTVMAAPEVSMTMFGMSRLGVYPPKQVLDSMMSRLVRSIHSHHQQYMQQGSNMAAPSNPVLLVGGGGRSPSTGQVVAKAVCALARMAQTSRGMHGLSQGAAVWSLLNRCAQSLPHSRQSTGQPYPMSADNVEVGSAAAVSGQGRLQAVQKVPYVHALGDSRRGLVAQSYSQPRHSRQLQCQLVGWHAMDVALCMNALSHLRQAMPRAWAAAALQHVHTAQAGWQGGNSKAAAIAACAVVRLHRQHVSAVRRRLGVMPEGNTALASRRHGIGPGNKLRSGAVKFQWQRPESWSGMVAKQRPGSKQQWVPGAAWLPGWATVLAPLLTSYADTSAWQRLTCSQVADCSLALPYLALWSVASMSIHHSRLLSSAGQQVQYHARLLLTAHDELFAHAQGLAAAGLLDAVQVSMLLRGQLAGLRVHHLLLRVNKEQRSKQHELGTAPAVTFLGKEVCQQYMDVVSTQQHGAVQLLSSASASGAGLAKFGARELCHVLAALNQLAISPAQLPKDWLRDACMQLHQHLLQALAVDAATFSSSSSSSSSSSREAAVYHAEQHSRHPTMLAGPGRGLQQQQVQPLGKQLKQTGRTLSLSPQLPPSQLTLHDCQAGLAGVRGLLQTAGGIAGEELNAVDSSQNWLVAGAHCEAALVQVELRLRKSKQRLEQERRLLMLLQ